VTRGRLPQTAGSLGLTAVGLPPRYPLRGVNSTDLSVRKNTRDHCQQMQQAAINVDCIKLNRMSIYKSQEYRNHPKVKE